MSITSICFPADICSGRLRPISHAIRNAKPSACSAVSNSSPVSSWSTTFASARWKKYRGITGQVSSARSVPASGSAHVRPGRVLLRQQDVRSSLSLSTCACVRRPCKSQVASASILKVMLCKLLSTFWGQRGTLRSGLEIRHVPQPSTITRADP
jgi:hypothetical protein